ncbi:50S ribosomal protein L3 [Candidatus Termititenax persephonae]|uniref:Large ribosomal subunit protein uL3 n=1 Tax=Candidatus Termititenax persephonae TaxID=2218525 RepID=A0A388TG04_9BACT|nr:50S ribosomal protein L3 [Candidatus Termititenax persephonae]
MKSILGRKIGMTQVFTADGLAQAVTVIECGPCVVLQAKKKDGPDGYSALRLGFLDQKQANKADLGSAKKVNLEKAKRYIREVRVPAALDIPAGSVIDSSLFVAGEKVSVSGTSIGKGFQGAIKRHGFTIGPRSHGSKNNRITGSQRFMDRGGRIPSGAKMPGHMGAERVTIRGLKVVEVLPDKNVILVSGAIPGPKNGLVVVSNRHAEYDAGKIAVK